MVGNASLLPTLFDFQIFASSTDPVDTYTGRQVLETELLRILGHRFLTTTLAYDFYRLMMLNLVSSNGLMPKVTAPAIPMMSGEES